MTPPHLMYVMYAGGLERYFVHYVFIVGAWWLELRYLAPILQNFIIFVGCTVIARDTEASQSRVRHGGRGRETFIQPPFLDTFIRGPARLRRSFGRSP